MSQGWKKAFERLFWKNRPSTDTPLNATDMNHIESGIDTLDDRIVRLDVLKADAQVVNGMVADVSLNSNTGVITVTYKNGSHVDYDTNLEKIAVNFSYDYVNQRLVLTLPDGTTQYVDMSALITQYEFKDSTTIAFSVDSTGKVSASVKNGSITEAMLETGYLANIKVEVAKAEAASSQAQSSETSSDYNAKLSRSYAIGGSGIREGEDTDNAMYYYEQAKKTDIGQIRSEVDELNSNLDALEFGEVAGGKNLFKYNEVSGTLSKTVECSLDAGTYTISALVNSSDTDSSTSLIDFYYEDGTNESYLLERESRTSYTFTLTKHVIALIFYASKDYANSANDTFTYSDIQIEKGTTATEYEPYIPSVKMLADEVNAQKNDLDVKSGDIIYNSCEINDSSLCWCKKSGHVVQCSLYLKNINTTNNWQAVVTLPFRPCSTFYIYDSSNKDVWQINTEGELRRYILSTDLIMLTSFTYITND